MNFNKNMLGLSVAILFLSCQKKSESGTDSFDFGRDVFRFRKCFENLCKWFF